MSHKVDSQRIANRPVANSDKKNLQGSQQQQMERAFWQSKALDRERPSTRKHERKLF
jgi:hypothetical protein